MSNSEYCLLSKDLLFLLKWICENNSDLLKKMVNSSWKKGFKKFYKENNIKNINEKEIEDLKDIVFDFFCIIEDNLLEFIKKEKVIKKEVSLLLDIHKEVIINIEINDEEKVKSLYILQEILKNKKELSKEEIKKIFFKAFLEEWNPKNNILN